jgi:hypothetical protein
VVPELLKAAAPLTPEFSPMFRTIPLVLVVLAACGPMPSMPDAGSTITLGNTSSSSMPAPMGGSPNV